MASSTLNEPVSPGSVLPGPVLIVGGDSMTGRALAASLTADGVEVFATTRRRDTIGAQRPFVDLDTGDWSDTLSRRYGTAYLCAAMARLDPCVAEPERAMRINADNMAVLAAALAAGGAYVVLLSTNQVFDGSHSCPLAATPPSPTSAYGRTKAAAERLVLDRAGAAAHNGPAPAVLRLSKVVDPGMTLLASWVDMFRRGETVLAARDMMLAPLPLALVVVALRGMAACRLPGIAQLEAGGEISYEEAARHVARRCGVSPDRVHPVDSVAAGFLKEPPPAHTRLDGRELRDALGIIPPDPYAVLDGALDSALGPLLS